MSFMGKGVTRNAVICLLHLSHEIMAENKGKVKINNAQTKSYFLCQFVLFVFVSVTQI